MKHFEHLQLQGHGCKRRHEDVIMCWKEGNEREQDHILTQINAWPQASSLPASRQHLEATMGNHQHSSDAKRHEKSRTIRTLHGEEVNPASNDSNNIYWIWCLGKASCQCPILYLVRLDFALILQSRTSCWIRSYRFLWSDSAFVCGARRRTCL